MNGKLFEKAVRARRSTAQREEPALDVSHGKRVAGDDSREFACRQLHTNGMHMRSYHSDKHTYLFVGVLNEMWWRKGVHELAHPERRAGGASTHNRHRRGARLRAI